MSKTFLQQVKDFAMRNYEKGGSVIIECFDDSEILEQFKTLEEVQEYCGGYLEQSLNCREGNDSDYQLLAYNDLQDNGWT